MKTDIRHLVVSGFFGAFFALGLASMLVVR
jgi:hypothetical protein